MKVTLPNISFKGWKEMYFVPVSSNSGWLLSWYHWWGPSIARPWEKASRTLGKFSLWEKNEHVCQGSSWAWKERVLGTDCLCPWNSYVESLTPSVRVLGGEAFERWLVMPLGGGTLMNGLVSFKLWVYVCVLSCFSSVQLFATLWTLALQDPLFMEFSRQEYWSE